MRRRAGVLLSLIALSVGTIAAPMAARQQRGTQPQPSGTARLTGRVIAADNGRPVRRAHVTLSGLPTAQRNAGPDRQYVSRRAETGADGRFDFADLPPGSYSITVDVVSGFAPPARPNEATLHEGRTAEMTIRLDRTGAIEGRIRDEHGDAMLGVHVQAVRRQDVAGHMTLAPVGAPQTTNDLGGFRLFNLPAGEYFVVATYARPDSREDPAPRSGYADTWYPGSPSARRGARAVVVSAGRDTERVDFALAPCRLARISIHPVDSLGVPLGAGAQLTLTRYDDVYLPSSTRHTFRREDGTLEFTGVAPGDYYLVVTKGSQMEEAAYVDVTVAGDDVSLNVRTNAGARVSGRVIIDGRPAGDGPNVVVAANTPPGKYGPLYARVPLGRVTRTDRFELAGLRGPMVLWAEVAGGALLSMQRGDDDLAGRSLEFTGTEVIDDVVVSLTTRVAHVDVTVTGTRAPDTPEAVLVILFAEDPGRRHHYSRYTRTTASRAPARATTFTRIAPGRYLIAAVPDADVDFPVEPAVLEKLRPFARPITVVAGETTKVALRLERPPRPR